MSNAQRAPLHRLSFLQSDTHQVLRALHTPFHFNDRYKMLTAIVAGTTAQQILAKESCFATGRGSVWAEEIVP